MTIAKSKEGLAAVRREHPDNHYATPVSLAVQFTEYIARMLGSRIFDSVTDPGVGEFPAFGYAVRRIFPDSDITGLETRFLPQFDVYSQSYQDDYVGSRYVRGTTYGNPPFSLARDILLYSRHRGPATILLLRHAFWESADRYEGLWSKGLIPHYTFPLTRRVPWWLYNTKHKGKKNTNTTQYAFFVWRWDRDIAEYSKTIPFEWALDESIEANYKALYVQEK